MTLPQKVLVTGASGLLGHTLVPELRAAGFGVVAHGHSHGMDVAADLADPQAAGALLDAVAPDVIVNLVGLTDVDRCEGHPNEAYRLNVRCVENLTEWMSRGRKTALVHISTDQVYDQEGPHREADVTITNTYALSKYAGELAALTANATVLRTCFFGPSRLSGRPSFSDWLIDKFRSGQSFTGFDDVRFSPLAMDTLARMIRCVIEGPVPGLFNLGSSEGMSKFAFAQAIARRFGLDPTNMRRGSRSDVNLKAYRPSDMRMDSRHFETTFGVALPALQAEIDRLELKT
jgi:dTDP-4-dehydrorhamnose reductase